MVSNALKLKEHLPTNSTMTLRMKKRAGTYPSKFKPDEMQTLYFFEAEGKEYSYYAAPREEEVLSLYQPGDEIQVTRQEKVMDDGKRIAFQVWGTPGSVEMTAPPQLQGNTATIRNEKDQQARQDEQKEKDIRICLQGFMQAYIAGTDFGAGNITPDGAVEQSLAYAVSARAALIAKAKELAA